MFSEPRRRTSGIFGISALILFLAGEARSEGHVCDAQSLGQIPSLKGWWEPHDDPSFRGIYDSVSCPVWGKDWDCMLDGEATEEQRASVYNKACFCLSRMDCSSFFSF